MLGYQRAHGGIGGFRDRCITTACSSHLGNQVERTIAAGNSFVVLVVGTAGPQLFQRLQHLAKLLALRVKRSAQLVQRLKHGVLRLTTRQEV